MLDHIGQIPDHAAKKFKDKEALVFEGQSFTFYDLNVLIEKTAGGLHSLGIIQGDVLTVQVLSDLVKKDPKQNTTSYRVASKGSRFPAEHTETNPLWVCFWT